MEGIAMFVFIGVIIVGMAIAYKKRLAIAKWLEDPSLALSADKKTRRTQLNRRIEDAQRELELLDEIEASKHK